MLLGSLGRNPDGAGRAGACAVPVVGAVADDGPLVDPSGGRIEPDLLGTSEAELDDTPARPEAAPGTRARAPAAEIALAAPRPAAVDAPFALREPDRYPDFGAGLAVGRIADALIPIPSMPKLGALRAVEVASTDRPPAVRLDGRPLRLLSRLAMLGMGVFQPMRSANS